MQVSASPSCASNFSSRSYQILAVFSSVKMVSQYPSSNDAQLHRTYTSRDSLYRSLFFFHICCAGCNNQFLSGMILPDINISRRTIQYSLNRVCTPTPIYISKTHFITYLIITYFTHNPNKLCNLDISLYLQYSLAVQVKRYLLI